VTVAVAVTRGASRTARSARTDALSATAAIAGDDDDVTVVIERSMAEPARTGASASATEAKIFAAVDTATATAVAIANIANIANIAVLVSAMVAIANRVFTTINTTSCVRNFSMIEVRNLKAGSDVVPPLRRWRLMLRPAATTTTTASATSRSGHRPGAPRSSGRHGTYPIGGTVVVVHNGVTSAGTCTGITRRGG